MSSDEEAEQFVGDEQTLHGDSQVVADLAGGDEAPIDDEDSDDDTSMPEEDHNAQDESVHAFEGHTGRKCGKQIQSHLADDHDEISVTILVGPAGAVFAVAWHPNSDLVATGGADDRVFLWQVCTAAKDIAVA